MSGEERTRRASAWTSIIAALLIFAPIGGAAYFKHEQAAQREQHQQEAYDAFVCAMNPSNCDD